MLFAPSAAGVYGGEATCFILWLAFELIDDLRMICVINKLKLS